MAVACLPSDEKLFTLRKDGSVGRLSKDAKKLGPKTFGALNTILAQNPNFGFVVDMQDRRLRSIVDEGCAPFPVFGFNRAGDDQNRLLWPLPTYHEFESPHFLKDMYPQHVPWRDKKACMVWRGITTGRAAGQSAGRGEGIRVKAALRRYNEGKIGERRLQRIISTAPRYRLVSLVQDNPRYDFGFVDGDGYIIAQTPLHSHLERPRLTRQEMQTYRYIAVLRGVDVGSSFYWVMNSGSVGFVQNTPFHTFASAHFEPWQHYIPFCEDGSDLDAHFDWAENHQKECQEITVRAATVSTLLGREDLRKSILAAVVAQLNARDHVEPTHQP